MVAALDERAVKLSAKAKQRKRCALDLKFEEYEQVVELAELHQEDLAVVLRACFRFGLAHHQQWGRNDGSAFLDGTWNPRPQHQIDPTGMVRPAPLQVAPFTRPITDGVRLSHTQPPPREQLIVEDEAIFSDAAIDPRALPQGATERITPPRRTERLNPALPEAAEVFAAADEAATAQLPVAQAAAAQVRQKELARTRKRRTKAAPAPAEAEFALEPTAATGDVFSPEVVEDTPAVDDDLADLL